MGHPLPAFCIIDSISAEVSATPCSGADAPPRCGRGCGAAAGAGATGFGALAPLVKRGADPLVSDGPMPTGTGPDWLDPPAGSGATRAGPWASAAG